MTRSLRPVEYFEISFLAGTTMAPFNSPNSPVQLVDPILERATIELSGDEEECILREFAAIQVDLAEAPPSRVTYRICFRSILTRP